MIVQKYLHDLAGWNALPTEEQERIIGRTKLSDIELDDATKPSSAHNVLTSIEKDGQEFQIIRDNMPFGRAGGEFGTYFIGYSRTPETIEQMLENMFIGNPPGNYDRLLDFSRAVTGSLFFVPSATFLDDVTSDESPAAVVLGSSGVERLPSHRPPDGFASPISVHSKEGESVNNLHRGLAPISDEAWAQIEEEATRTLKVHLAGRRVVEIPGAQRNCLRRGRHGPLCKRYRKLPEEGIVARQREVKALVELRAPLR